MSVGVVCAQMLRGCHVHVSEQGVQSCCHYSGASCKARGAHTCECQLPATGPFSSGARKLHRGTHLTWLLDTSNAHS